MKHILFFLISVVISSTSFAVSLSNSGVEITFKYTAQFRSLRHNSDGASPNAAGYAEFHAAHLFGIVASPAYAKQYGYSPELLEGFAGTKSPTIIDAQFYAVPGDRYLWVTYTAVGKMLVLNKIAQSWFAGKQTAIVTLPLLKDLPSIYNDDLEDYRNSKWLKCTDKTYPGTADFSYFYTPYSCPSLIREPLAKEVRFKIALIDKSAAAKSVFPHQQIYGDNGNGPLTVLYFLEGYDDSPIAGSSPQKVRSDATYQIFRNFEKLLSKDYGFTEISSTAELRALLGKDFSQLKLITPVTQTHIPNRTFFRTYVKKSHGQTFVIRQALLNTDNAADEKPVVSFLKFWKEAWENGDYIYFGGHSGDGQSLDIDSINLKLMSKQLSRHSALENVKPKDLNAIRFSQNKTQIAFIDACTSYDHYQDMYNARKSANLYMVTYGLVSLFHNAEATMRHIVEIVTQPKVENSLWLEVMHSLEESQLSTQLDFLYYDDAITRDKVYKKYLQADQLPSFLINVSVPQ